MATLGPLYQAKEEFDTFLLSQELRASILKMSEDTAQLRTGALFPALGLFTVTSGLCKGNVGATHHL